MGAVPRGTLLVGGWLLTDNCAGCMLYQGNSYKFYLFLSPDIHLFNLIRPNSLSKISIPYSRGFLHSMIIHLGLCNLNKLLFRLNLSLISLISLFSSN